MKEVHFDLHDAGRAADSRELFLVAMRCLAVALRSTSDVTVTESSDGGLWFQSNAATLLGTSLLLSGRTGVAGTLTSTDGISQPQEIPTPQLVSEWVRGEILLDRVASFAAGVLDLPEVQARIDRSGFASCTKRQRDQLVARIDNAQNKSNVHGPFYLVFHEEAPTGALLQQHQLVQEQLHIPLVGLHQSGFEGEREIVEQIEEMMRLDTHGTR